MGEVIRTLTVLLALCAWVHAQDERRLPPPGISVSPAERAELERGIEEFRAALGELRSRVADRPSLSSLLPDVEVFYKAVDWALRYDELFRERELGEARELLERGLERARQLAAGEHPWTTATGLVVRGYRSRIDDSAQPYGLVVPESWRSAPARKRRLDFWLHGRGNTLSELRFITDRLTKRGEFTPDDTFVLHPYGRFCNANKFAGEVDLFEALAHAKEQYPIDDDRVLIRGFSMGGAATWHLAAHHAGLFAAASPGAGFAETAVYQNIFRDKVPPTEIEQTLWHLYDATDYAVNFFNCPVVAYSGEIDKQKQAADIMAAAMKAEGLDLVHLIGPGTGHKYHPETKKEVARQVDALAARGRDAVPPRVRFTTFTLRYNRMKWVVVDGLEQHWRRARVDAAISGDRITVATSNVSALTLSLPAGRVPNSGKPAVVLDDIPLQPPLSSGDWTARFHKNGGRWSLATGVASGGLRKRHGLQGPIDDAFMDRFVIVTATDDPMSRAVGDWVEREQARAIEHWRRFFRGLPRVVTDRELTDEDVGSSHLVLWGDPSSHRVLKRIGSRLPIHWDRESVRVGEATFSSGEHVPVLVFPNPLNPERYVVLNSGYTFQDNSHMSNSRHVPMLPDWAILRINAPAGAALSQRTASAGFFGEEWELR